MFGWAKPVPVDATRFRYPRQGMALVAIAGPVMNFSLAFLAALVLRSEALSKPVASAISAFIVLNLVLGLFNLVPIPPLDGGRIAVGILPRRLALAWAGVERFGILFVLGLVALPAILGQAGIHFNPLGQTLYPAVEWAYGLTLHLAGAPDVAD